MTSLAAWRSRACTADLDVLVMGSLFVELTPEPSGEPLAQMARLVPLASGAAGNFALQLAALGVRAGILTAVGADALGDWCLSALARQGLETSSVVRLPDQLTTVSFASADLRGGKEFLFYRFPGYSDPLAALSPATVSAAQVQRARLFDFTEAVIRTPEIRATALQAARWAREAGRLVVYAANYRPQAWACGLREMRAAQLEALDAADLVVMNQDELRLILEVERLSEATQSHHYQDKTIVVTHGDKGGVVYNEGQGNVYTSREVAVTYDVGAGDAFHAGLVAALLQGRDPREAAEFGVAVAALKISRPASAALPSRGEVLALLASG